MTCNPMRVIHTADVHLGAVPDAGMPWAAERAAAVKDTFVRLIERVRAEKPALLLISGDLFHRQPQAADLAFVGALFASVPETNVVLCAGNHDYLTRDARMARYSWSPNVTGLWGKRPESVSLPHLDTRVYGLSYHGFEAPADLYEGVRPFGPEAFHILLLHGGDAKHSPVKRETLAAMGFDYIAMGHIHRPGFAVPGRAAWSGALTPIDRNDTGPHGYLEAELIRNETPRIRFMPFAPFAYETVTIRTEPTDSVQTVEERIRRTLAGRKKENSFRIVLTGGFSLAGALDVSRLADAGHVLEITDQTEDIPDYEALCRNYPGSLLEAYIRKLENRTDAAGRIALAEGTKAILETGAAYNLENFL